MILKALGATRGFVSRVFAVEYALLGAAAGLAGSALAAVLAWAVLRFALDVPWRWAPGTLLGGVATATALALLVGFLGTRRLLTPPRSACCEASDAARAAARATRRPRPEPQAVARGRRRVEVNGHRFATAARVPAGDTVSLAARRAAPFPRGLSLVHETTRSSWWSSRPASLSIATDRERSTRTACSGTTWRPSGGDRSSSTGSIARRQATLSASPRRRSGRSRRSSRRATWSGVPRAGREAAADEGHAGEQARGGSMLRVRSAERPPGHHPLPRAEAAARGCLLELRLGRARHQIRVPRRGRAGRSSATSPTAGPGAASGVFTPRGSASCIRRRSGRSSSRGAAADWV